MERLSWEEELHAQAPERRTAELHSDFHGDESAEEDEEVEEEEAELQADHRQKESEEEDESSSEEKPAKKNKNSKKGARAYLHHASVFSLISLVSLLQGSSCEVTRISNIVLD
mgnify:CR=1 FL=1